MRMFDYARAEDEADAVTRGQIEGARFIAGGTNLLDLMKLEIEAPEGLVDIGRLAMTEVAETADGSLSIGALVPNADLAAHPLVRARYPMLSRALLAGASPQLRNKATTGGNLLQRTRCVYFYEPASACNKRKPGSGCPAMDGFNRNCAVLGTSDACIAAHPSDMAVAMRALDAVVSVRGADGAKRDIAVADFHLEPGDAPHVETVLEPGDLITHVTLPPATSARQTYRKVRDRASYAFALVSIAASLSVEDGKIAAAQIAFGGIGTVPWRDADVEAMLVGEVPSAALFGKAADRLLAGATGHGHNDFKIARTRRLMVGTLSALADGKLGEEVQA